MGHPSAAVLTREKTPKTVLTEWIVVRLPFLHAIERLIDVYVVEFGSSAHNSRLFVCLPKLRWNDKPTRPGAPSLVPSASRQKLRLRLLFG